MDFYRRDILKVLSLGGAMTLPLAAGLLGTPALGATDGTEVGPNGLHTQSWFLESFLELKDDLSEAHSNNKGLILLFEQRGCPYCAELHKVNLSDEKISRYMQAHFDTIQLDIWGSREVTDFDGKAFEERRLASRWGVSFTPTMVFFTGPVSDLEGKSSREAEAARLPGYFKPFHFLSMLEYVAEGHSKRVEFQKYLQEKFEAKRKKGEKPDVW